MRHAAVRTMPKDRWTEFPEFLVFAEWADDRAAGDITQDEPTMKFWEVWFQGVDVNGRGKWFIWRIPGLRGDWNDFRQRLSERAGEFGLTCVYIYNDPRPMTREMYDLVVEMNEDKKAA